MEEFTNSIGRKIFYGFFACVSLLVCLFVLTIDLPQSANWMKILFVIAEVLVALLAVNKIKLKIIISADNIVMISLFGKKELSTANIRGFRYTEKVLYIEPESPGLEKITIRQYEDLKNFEDLATWLRENFKDLDMIDFKKDEDKVLNDTRFGFTEEERKLKLVKAKRLANLYNIGGFIAGAAIICCGLNYINPLAILEVIYPLVAILVMTFSKGLIKFASYERGSVYPCINLGFYATAFSTCLSAGMPYDIFDTTHLFVPITIVTIAITTLLYISGINKSGKLAVKQVTMMLVAAALYGLGIILALNFEFDNSKTQVFTAKVLERRMDTRKSTTYYLTLGPWGPSKQVEEVRVRGGVYYGATVGKAVKVNFKTGLLNIPFFEIFPPNSVPTP